jgi:hypothetical protein
MLGLSFVFTLQTKTPTIIKHDEHEFIFEGFSMFSHFPLDKLPTCKVIRFNIEYTILYIDEKLPENFTIRELDLFCKYLGAREIRVRVCKLMLFTVFILLLTVLLLFFLLVCSGLNLQHLCIEYVCCAVFIVPR